MSPTAASHVNVMISAAPAKRYNCSCARMLVAVAAASPYTTSLPRTKTSANGAAMMMIAYRMPAILALRRGDTAAICSIIPCPSGGSPPDRSEAEWLSFLSDGRTDREEGSSIPKFGVLRYENKIREPTPESSVLHQWGIDA